MFVKINAQSAKRIAISLALVAFSVVTATVPASGQADTDTHNTKAPLTGFVVYIPCAAQGMGENVVLVGYLHYVDHWTYNGNKLIIKYHIQPQQVSGVGLSTGMRYQGTGVTQGIRHTSIDGLQYNNTVVGNFRIIGQGPGNNFLVHSLVHVTINANGETTAYVDNYSAECK